MALRDGLGAVVVLLLDELQAEPAPLLEEAAWPAAATASPGAGGSACDAAAIRSFGLLVGFDLGAGTA